MDNTDDSAGLVAVTEIERGDRLLTLSGLVLVFIGILCNAYWQDAVRWDAVKLQASREGNRNATVQAERFVSRAKGVFRFGTCLALLVLISMACSAFGGQHVRSRWFLKAGEVLMMILLVILIVSFACLAVVADYFVPVESSDLLLSR